MVKGSSRLSLPTRYVRIGSILVRYGKTLECVERPKGLAPCDACRGCWFSTGKGHIGGGVVNCRDIQCSSWDRMDGRNVWFVEASEE